MEKVTRDLRRAPMAGGAVRPAAEEHVAAPARPEAQRLSPATLPTAPGRAIAHEAHAMASEPQVANLDYGREIALPASALAAAAAPPAPASPSVVMPRPEPIAAASPVHRAAPAPVQHAAPAPVQHAAPAPVRHAAPAPVHHAAPAPAAPVHREAPPMPAPMAMPQAAPAVDPNGHPTAAASEGAMVVPVRIPRNGSREIVLRIVLSVDE
jgi:hypothetical protein